MLVVNDLLNQLLTLFQVSSKLSAAKARGSRMFEPCLVVTSAGIFVLKFARDPVTTFLECSMQVNKLRKSYSEVTLPVALSLIKLRVVPLSNPTHGIFVMKVTEL